MKEKKFKYMIDEFADIKVLRFRIDEFNNLNLKQKEYVYYLSEAAKWGRDILWLQKDARGLTIRKTLENIINTYQGDKTDNIYQVFLLYAKRIFFSNGIYHHYNKTKIIPEISRTEFESLIDNSDVNKFPINKTDKFEDFKIKLLEYIYAEDIEDGDLLTRDKTNFYQNVTEKEAKSYYENLIEECDKKVPSFGLNTKLVKANNLLYEDVYKVNGLYGKAIEKIIYWLEKASKVSENDEQKKYTELLIEYYRTGDIRKWDEYNIAWTIEDKGLVDYINGFIEVYDDPIAIKGTWEAMVNIKDLEETRITEIIAQNAQWFEDNSPTDVAFKKKKVKGISAKAIHAITLGGDCYPSSPVGINLPNSNWIREEYGSKSVSISNISKAFDAGALEAPVNVRGEFTYDKSDLDVKRELNIIGSDLHTHLHECLGHGSGIILPNVSPNALNECHSTLEEARADLFALYYLADKKLIDLGIIKTLDVAKVFYETYIKNGLQVQLVRIKLGDNVIQAHMQARKMISEMAYELACKDKIIEKIVENNKTYFVVNDYLRLRDIFGELLKEIQRIKSEGDYVKGKELINKYAIKVDRKLHEEVLDRYSKLNLKPYSGFINPELSLVKDNGTIIDVGVKYPSDFLKQQIQYGKKYSALN